MLEKNRPAGVFGGYAAVRAGMQRIRADSGYAVGEFASGGVTETTAQTDVQDQLPTTFSLREIGNFEKPEAGLSFHEKSGAFIHNDTQWQHIAADGTCDWSFTGDDVEEYANGVWVVTKNNEEFSEGMLIDGMPVLDCTAAIIKKLSDRYFEVYYATGAAESEDEALFFSYITNGFELHLFAQDGDALY